MRAAAGAIFKRASAPAAANPFAQLLAGEQAKATVSLWPENAEAFAVFNDLRTQWRIGPAGPTGLDYVAMYRELDERGYSGGEREQMKQDIREMERAALDASYAD